MIYPFGNVVHVSAQSANVRTVASSSISSPVANVVILDQNPLVAGTNYTLLVFRYSEVGGSTIASVDSAVKAGELISLQDTGLSSFYHSQPSIHYSISVLQNLANGSIAQLISYHWAAPVIGSVKGIGGTLAATEHLQLTQLANGTTLVVVNGVLRPYQEAPTSSPTRVYGNATTTNRQSPITTLTQGSSSQSSWPTTILHPITTTSTSLNAHAPTNVVSPNTPAQNGCYSDRTGDYCWVAIQYWYTQPTTIGEATGSGYMTDQFSYGVSSGSTLDVVASANAGPWSVSGEWTQYNTGTSAVQWAQLHCCTNFYANTYFDYEEDQCAYCTFGGCTYYSQYQIWASAFDAGNEDWLSAGSSSSSPGDCLDPSTLNGVYSYAPYAANSGYTYTTANGYTYNYAITIGSNIYGTSYSATIRDTTNYNQYTTQQLTFGSQYTTYYVYTNGIYGGGATTWPVLFSTNPPANCGP